MERVERGKRYQGESGERKDVAGREWREERDIRERVERGKR